MAIQITDSLDAGKVAELRERLTFLHRLANATLEAKTEEILRGQEGELRIHEGKLIEVHARNREKSERKVPTINELGEELKTREGTVVEVHRRVEFKHERSPKTFDDVLDATLNNSLKDVFSEHGQQTIKDHIKAAVDSFFSKDSVGEAKERNVIMLWDKNILLRIDYFLWRYNFSNRKIFEHVDAVFGYTVVKRVVDPATVSPEILSHAIPQAVSGEGSEVPLFPYTDESSGRNGASDQDSVINGGGDGKGGGGDHSGVGVGVVSIASSGALGAGIGGVVAEIDIGNGTGGGVGASVEVGAGAGVYSGAGVGVGVGIGAGTGVSVGADARIGVGTSVGGVILFVVAAIGITATIRALQDSAAKNLCILRKG